MPGTFYKGSHYTYDGKPEPADNKIRYVGPWADALEPRATPLLSAMRKVGAINTRPHYWGQSVRVGMSSTLASGINDSVTTFSVAANGGVYFKKWHVAQITNYVTGTTRLDPTRREIVWLGAETNVDALQSVTRGAAGTTAIAHDAGAFIEIIGTAEPENENHTKDTVARGFQVGNDFQRFVGGLQADKRAQVQPSYERRSGNQMMADFEDVQRDLRVQLEKSIIFNKDSQAGNSTGQPSMLGGIRKFITTNVTDLNNAVLSAYDIETLMRAQKKAVSDGGATTLLASYDTAAIWDTMANPYRRMDMDDNTINLTLERIRTRWGTYTLGISHWLPDGEIWVVDLRDMEYMPFEGLDWHVKRHETDGDYDWISFSGDFSFRLRREARMALIKGFESDLDAYPRKDYF